MAYHNEFGKWGEEVAARYLQQKGYAIVERNWRCGHDEIDIIARRPDSDVWVFVEVKTRRDEEFETAEEAVDDEKMYHISNAAKAFLRMNRFRGDVRYDLIAVTADNRMHEAPVIRHIEDFFDPRMDLFRYSPNRRRNRGGVYCQPWDKFQN